MPLPWTRTGSSFGFGDAPAHLPQPAWFGEFSVEAEENDRASTLSLYRAALDARRELQTAEELEWVAGYSSTDSDLLHFVRPGDWHVLCNFGTTPVALPTGEVIVASGPLSEVAGAELPGETAVWIRA